MVKEVTEYQGKYSLSVIKAGLFESIMWPYLGKLKAPIAKVQKKYNDKGKLHWAAAKKPISK